MWPRNPIGMSTRRQPREEWLRLGATARLQQLDAERAEIFAAFPDFKLAIKSEPGMLRKRLSPAARRAMSAGMKRFWAEHRAKQKETR